MQLSHEDNQSNNTIVFEYILKFFFCIIFIYFALQKETIDRTGMYPNYYEPIRDMPQLV